MIKIIITAAGEFLAIENQFQLLILELGDLGHQLGSFSPTQDTRKGQQ